MKAVENLSAHLKGLADCDLEPAFRPDPCFQWCFMALTHDNAEGGVS